MLQKNIIVSEHDFHLILNLIDSSFTIDPLIKKSHRQLYNHLKSAEVTTSELIPNTVIRINSVVDIKTSFGRKMGLRIVEPDEGDMKRNKLSVLSPIGAAILGFSEGDKVEWLCHGTIETLLIEKVINEG